MIRTFFMRAQQLGRALMLPIAVLPIAGLLLRLGQPDLLDIKLVAQAGEAVFANLALLFAIGVAVGFARESHGVAGLAGAVGHLVMVSVLKAVDPQIDMGVLAGIVSGITAGSLYNRTKDIKLPEYLAFFGGKRFAAIATGLACLALGMVFGTLWPPVQRAIDTLGHWLLGAGAIGLFVYGALNRLLIVTGLHHILNSLVWFVFGSFEAAGKTVTGDLHRFFAGDPSAGMFMTGFFPVMMFGLPAACLAMYRSARPENRRAVGGMLLSMGLTSFLTGVTEPVEFAYMFLAPALYAVHAALTGLSMALMHLLDVRLGFTFSAGAFDYLLSYGLSSNGWLLLPIGAFTFVVYYALFSVCIRRFDLQTPGREALSEGASSAAPAVTLGAGANARAEAFIRALGGPANLKTVEACVTRLRLTVARTGSVDDAALKALGAKGVVRPAPGSVQVVLGPEADRIADSIRHELSRSPGDAAEGAPAAPAGSPTAPSSGPVEALASVTSADGRAATAGGTDEAASGPPAIACATTAGGAVDPSPWLAALGGEHNVRSVRAVASTRLRVELFDPSRLDERALQRAGASGLMRLQGGCVHVIIGARAAALVEALSGSMAPDSRRTAG